MNPIPSKAVLRFAGSLLAAFVPAVAAGAETAVDLAVEGQKPPAYEITDLVRATDVPVIRLPARAPLAPEEIARIKRHIANLALIDSPDMGLSGTYGGSSFAPLPQMTEAGTIILGSPRPKTADDLVELVKLGPRALPYLLEALDDPTPTRLVLGPAIKSASGATIGGMFRANGISGNPANAMERTATASLRREALALRAPIKDQKHRVTVGDVCFVIIGQITGRHSYSVARYQPTAITIINSPTDDPALVKQVRAIWSADDPEQHLLDALLLDFATTIRLPKDAPEALKGEAVTAWFYPSEAAMRLLYYFPDVAGEWVARRLILEVDADEFRKDSHRRLLEAVVWSDHPAIRQGVLEIFRETTEPGAFLVCLPAVPETDNDLVLRRTLALLDALPPDARPDDWGHGPYDDGYRLVRAAGERLGAASKPVYLRYMEQPTFRRRVALCAAVRARPEWAVELLTPLLDDKREERMWYQKVAGNDEDRPAIRVCDDAARTISLSRPDLPFVLHGTHADLDRQIAAMKERIEKISGGRSSAPAFKH